MAKTSFVSGLVGGLIVGGVVGFFVGKEAATRPDCTTPMTRTIIVYDNGSLSCSEAHIGRNDTVTWRASSGKTLQITFDQPSAFPARSCSANECQSGGWVDPDPNGADNQPSFRYSGTVGSGTGAKPLYGRIIVHK